MVWCQPYSRLPPWRSYLASTLYSLFSIVWYASQPANMLTFGNLPENSTAYFKPPPSERGTFDILSTCILTLVLCVYTCLHLNVPPHKASKWYQKKWGSKTIGILLGLLAPEIVVYIAVHQFYWANKLFHSMRKRLDPPGGDVEQAARLAPVSGGSLTARQESGQKRNPWTRYHSHFALMGGFALEQDDSQASFMPDTHTRLTLTPNALKKLAEVEPMLIPDISERSIKDKSKADWIAKTFACWQACWFISQFLGHAYTSIPISLLELNTFLHALCCLIIYLAWWWNPLDIGEPELIKTNDEHTCKIWAWMLMNSKLGSCRRLELGSSEEQKGFLVHNKDLYREGTSKLAHEAFGTCGLSPFEESRSENRDQPETQAEDAHSTPLKLYPGQMIHGFHFILNKHQTYPDNTYLTPDPATLECLRLADLLRTEADTADIWTFNWSDDLRRPDFEIMVVSHIDDFEYLNDGGLDIFTGPKTPTRRIYADFDTWLLLLPLGGLYGIAHIFAWHGPFPTPAQRWMWRISCLVLIVPLAILFLFSCFCLGFPKYRRDSTYYLSAPVWFPLKIIRTICSSRSTQADIATHILFWPFPLLYLAARVYISIGCFINISQLPPEVYHVPQWSQYIPHLGAG